MINIDTIIEFFSAIDNHLNEEQIYELVKNMYDNGVHKFAAQVKYFYCTILKQDYFDSAIFNKIMNIIHNENNNGIKEISHDIYNYCLNCVKDLK